MLWFDTTIFVLTLARAYQMHRRMPGGILETLFRDGQFLHLCVHPLAILITQCTGTIYYG